MTPLRYVGNFRPQKLGPPLDQILDPHLCVKKLRAPQFLEPTFLSFHGILGKFGNKNMGLVPLPGGFVPPP